MGYKTLGYKRACRMEQPFQINAQCILTNILSREQITLGEV